MPHNRKLKMANDIEQRLTELEIKASFSEDLIDKLDLIITRQQDVIDHLVRQMRTLAERFEDPSQQARTNLRDDLPPHY